MCYAYQKEEIQKMSNGIRLSDHFSYTRLLKFTLPSIGMMIFSSIYGVVDGFFVSNFAGKIPFAAVNLIYPILIIMSTVGFMFGTGGSAIVAKAFGEGKREYGNQCFSLFTYLSFGVGALLSVLGIIFMPEIAALLVGKENVIDNAEVLDNAVIYGRIILAALPFNILQFLFQSFFVTAEKPQLGLAVTVSAGCTNMALDALLVLLLPQEYKLAGAAIATAVSQLVGGGIPIFYFMKDRGGLLKLGKTKFYTKAIAQACVNGSSEFMSNIAMNLVAILYNLQLMKYAGNDGIAAYGVLQYVSLIFSGAFMGYSIGVAPVIGFHDGAKNHAELKNLLRTSLIIIGVFGVAMTALAELLAYPLSMIFVSYDEALLELTVSGFRIFAACFIFMGYAIFSSSFFTALNDGLTSAIISFLRTLVFQVAAVLILPLIFGIDGVWLSIVVAEVMAVILSVIFLIVKQKKYHY